MYSPKNVPTCILLHIVFHKLSTYVDKYLRAYDKLLFLLYLRAYCVITCVHSINTYVHSTCVHTFLYIYLPTYLLTCIQ